LNFRQLERRNELKTKDKEKRRKDRRVKVMVLTSETNPPSNAEEETKTMNKKAGYLMTRQRPRNRNGSNKKARNLVFHMDRGIRIIIAQAAAH